MSFTDDSVQSDDNFSDEMNDLCLQSSQTSSAISVLSPYNQTWGKHLLKCLKHNLKHS